MLADAQRDGRPAEYIGGTLCESSVIPFLVPRRKVWLTPAAGVSCSNAANIRERKTWSPSEFCTWQNSVRGQKSPKVYIECASAGDSQRACKVSLAYGERHRCSNEAKTRNPLKFAGVPQTGKPISEIRHIEEDVWRRYCCLRFVSDCRHMP